MAYTILNTDGTTLVVLAEGKIDQTTTSLSLIGKNTSNFGEQLNNNLIKLLGNSASATATPPRSPIKGQLWYDTSIKRLKVYDNGFKNVSGVAIASTKPVTLQNGDLWFDSVNYQLNIISGGSTYLVGPAYASNGGIPSQGWVVPPITNPVKDVSTNVVQDILALKSYGNVVALAYYNNKPNDKFNMTTESATTYLPGVTDTPRVVSGITIPGDLRVYGQVTNNYLTVSFNIDNLIESPDNSMTDQAAIIAQNTIIANLLNVAMPSTPSTTGDYQYAGLPVGSVARVICYKNDSWTSTPHVRLFRTVGTDSSSYWQAWNIFALENVIS